jgi:hypothetical protein
MKRAFATTSIKGRRWENRPQLGELPHFHVSDINEVRNPAHALDTKFFEGPARTAWAFSFVRY